MKKNKSAAKPKKASTNASNQRAATNSINSTKTKKAAKSSKPAKTSKPTKLKKQGRFSSVSRGKKALIILVIIGAFAYFIYQPFCLWYGALRDNQIYQEQLTRYNESNSEMQDRADYLNTDEGQVEEARKHGYVEQGESVATVEGLPGDENTDTTSEESRIPKEISQAVLDEPDPFYVQILDFLFMYNKSQTAS